MQVSSPHRLSDVKSLELGTRTVDSLFQKIKAASDANRPAWHKDDNEHLSEIIHRTAWLYNNSNNYADEVLFVFNQIITHIGPKPEPPQIEQLYNAYFSRYHYRT